MLWVKNNPHCTMEQNTWYEQISFRIHYMRKCLWTLQVPLRAVVTFTSLLSCVHLPVMNRLHSRSEYDLFGLLRLWDNGIHLLYILFDVELALATVVVHVSNFPKNLPLFPSLQSTTLRYDFYTNPSSYQYGSDQPKGFEPGRPVCNDRLHLIGEEAGWETNLLEHATLMFAMHSLDNLLICMSTHSASRFDSASFQSKLHLQPFGETDYAVQPEQFSHSSMPRCTCYVCVGLGRGGGMFSGDGNQRSTWSCRPAMLHMHPT